MALNNGNTSAFERAVFTSLSDLYQKIRAHDRMVVFTLLIAVIPIPPLPIIALLMVVFQRTLIVKGELDQSEAYLLRLAFLFAILGILIDLVVVGLFYSHREIFIHVLERIVKFVEEVNGWIMKLLFGNNKNEGDILWKPVGTI